MELYNAILNRRSIRKFRDKEVSSALLKKFVNAGRFAPSGGNLQPWEFIIVNNNELVKEVFSTLKWANYLRDGTPPEGKRPVAYIIILINRDILPEGGEYDIGMAAENIMLSAFEEGIGSCCVGSINKEKLRNILNVPDYCEIELIIALGYPDEESIAEKMRDDSIKYWRDDNSKMHVPKRDLDKILHRNSYKNG